MFKDKGATKILFVHPHSAIDQRILEGLKYPPMGIAFLSAVARESGYDVHIFDANMEKKPLLRLQRILQEHKPDVVGISFTSLIADSAHVVARIVKEKDPGITVIAGGYHPTVMPEEVIKDASFDFVVRGEAEITFLEWLKRYEGDKDFAQVKGLVFRKDAEIFDTGKRGLIDDLDSLPIPAYDLLPLNRYSSLLSTRKPYVTFIRSRGCPFRCIFCGVQKMFGREYRCQSPEKTISEIDRLVKQFKVKEILFKDSDFLIDKVNVMRLCDILCERDYDLIWSCNARVDMVNKKTLDIMKKAGCRLISYGVESGDQTVLERLKKDITIEQIQEAIALTKGTGIQCEMSMILGCPGETKTSVSQTVEFVKKLNPDYAFFGYLAAFPGSELYDEALRYNWFIDGKPNSFGSQEMKLNATEMSNIELSRAVKDATRSFYFRKEYLFNKLRNLNLADCRRNFRGLSAILRNS